ncbi:pectinesterase family protein [Oleiharenicola lentus]|uniref:pectinesterase family protein n=1 Tax=Oleiharenicola lentus TaxID=2508720 RepID=UPI003F670DC5
MLYPKLCPRLMIVMMALVSALEAAQLFPAAKASDVNPDTHLVLTFSSAPTLGKSGFIRIFDTATNQLADTLDLSIPAGPTERGPIQTLPSLPPAEAAARVARLAALGAKPLGRVTNATAVAGTLGDGKNPTKDYQLTIIGGVQQGFHFHPVIIRGNVATIYPHHNLLTYGRTYRVEIDPGVLTLADGSFAGIPAAQGWTFTTKPAPPATDTTRVVVAADGSGDFNTVQGALDWVPAQPSSRVTIFVRNGHYEEIVFFHGKSNLTIRGEDREKVRIGYGNNSRFNAPNLTDADGNLLGGPSRRCAFACYNSSDVTLSNFTVSNYYLGQAEGLLIAGQRVVVDRVTINGSGDALNLKGTVYLTDSTINGHGDTILSTGAAFFNRCTLASWGPYMWIRNPATNHGHVFVECTFDTPPGDNPLFGRVTKSVLARLPDNKGVNYPHAEAVLIDCRLKDVPPEGWGPIQEGLSDVKFWEFNSTNLADGLPVDVRQRHPASRQLTLATDAELIANYRQPAFVLDGWTPIVER